MTDSKYNKLKETDGTIRTSPTEMKATLRAICKRLGITDEEIETELMAN